MHWQHEGLVADAVRAWVAAERIPDAEPGWEEEAVYEITATERPERWWTVGVGVPVSSGTMHVELSVGADGVSDGPSAQVVSARRPGRGRLQGTTFAYDRSRGWYEVVAEPDEPTLRMV